MTKHPEMTHSSSSFGCIKPIGLRVFKVAFCDLEACSSTSGKAVFKSTPTQFQTIIFAFSGSSNVGDNVGDVSEAKLTERQQKILNLIKESPTITGRQMSETLSVSQRTIERDISTLQKIGVLKREGKDNDGLWVIIHYHYCPVKVD